MQVLFLRFPVCVQGLRCVEYAESGSYEARHSIHGAHLPLSSLRSEPPGCCTEPEGVKTGIGGIHRAAVFLPGIVLAFCIAMSCETYCSSWSTTAVCHGALLSLRPELYLRPGSKGVKTPLLAVSIMLAFIFLVSPLQYPYISYRAYCPSWSTAAIRHGIRLCRQS
jgi:hypothetical protein